MEYPVKRNLDGYYFRVERNGKWENVCFSDLRADEMIAMLSDRSENWLISLCMGLGEQLHLMGDQLGIELVYDDEEFSDILDQ